MNGTPWNEEEVAYLRMHINDSVVSIMNALGRSKGSVMSERRKVRRSMGLPTRERTKWRADEIAFLYENYMTMSTDQMVERLGRTYSSVAGMLGTHGLVRPSNIRRRNPMEVGNRVLLARTCVTCGRLRSSRYFHRYRTSSGTWGWTSRCKTCARTRQRDERRGNDTVRTRGNTASKSFSARMTALLAPHAANSGQQYDEEQDRLVKDTKLPLVVVAMRTHRTYAGVAARATRLGVRRLKFFDADANMNWVIIFDQIGVIRALELEASGKLDPTGIPTEADWDWDDEDLKEKKTG